MTLSHSLFVGLGLTIVASLSWTSQPSVPDSGSAPAVAEAAPTALMWTTDTQGWPGGTWDGGVAAAAAYVDKDLGGYTDWRLPTVAELQAALQIRDGEPGSWGRDYRNQGGTMSGWTSHSVGRWAYVVSITTDANGYVVQPTGAARKSLKGSNFARTKFVRP